MKKHNYVILTIAILTFLGSVVSLFFLPDTIPMHWNMSGEIDGYGPKYYVLFLGALGLGIYFLMNLTKKIDPLEEKINEKADAYYLMRDLITLVMNALCIFIIMGIVIEEFPMTLALHIILGITFIAIGNYMPRVPHNYFLGVKTPWAIADEENWKKTQRMGGYVFVASGLGMLLGGLINQSWIMIVVLVSVLLGVIYLYFYSWSVYKHNKK